MQSISITKYQATLGIGRKEPYFFVGYGSFIRHVLFSLLQIISFMKIKNQLYYSCGIYDLYLRITKYQAHI